MLANNVTRDAITVSDTIAGTVNVYAGSTFIEGTGTKFGNVSTAMITVGTQIAVNSEIRTVNTVISNTNVRVSAAFTYTANDQTLVIL